MKEAVTLRSVILRVCESTQLWFDKMSIYIAMIIWMLIQNIIPMYVSFCLFFLKHLINNIRILLTKAMQRAYD